MQHRLYTSMVAFTVLLVFASAAAAAEAGPAAQGRPSLFLPEVTYTFPTVMEGTEVTRTFTVKNYGTAPLHIQKVRTG